MTTPINRVRHLLSRLDVAGDLAPTTDLHPMSIVPGWFYMRGERTEHFVDTPRKPRPAIAHAIGPFEYAFSSRRELVAFLRAEWMTAARAWIAQQVVDGKDPPRVAGPLQTSTEEIPSRPRWVLLLGQDHPTWHRLPPVAGCPLEGMPIDGDSRTRDSPPADTIVCGTCLAHTPG
jgi:hypothetical protein